MNNIFHKIGLLAVLAAVTFSLAVGALNSASAQDNPLAKLGEMIMGKSDNATSGNMTGNATMGGNMTGGNESSMTMTNST
ncbi:MAG TPA: hypothetical protein VH415_11765 [Nitrososphaeraceae archaeon]|jgi:hypothetical protein